MKRRRHAPVRSGLHGGVWALGMALALAATPAARADESCTLRKGLKVLVRQSDGEMVWTPVPPQAVITVKTRGSQWSLVDTPVGSGRTSSVVLEQGCELSPYTEIASAPVVVEAARPAKAKPKPGKRVAAQASAPPAAQEPPAPAVSATPAPVPTTVASVNAPAAEANAPPAVAVAAPERMVAVLDLKGSAGAAPVARALTTVLAAEVAALDGHRAVARNELQSLLQHQAEASLLGCESVGCLANVGRLVDADLVVAGAVESVEGAYIVTLSLVDPREPRVLERSEAAWRGAPEDLLALVRPMVGRLFGGAQASTWVGQLEVFAPAGSDVFVDGKAVGTAPLAAPLRSLPLGVHTVVVSKAGSVTAERDVVVQRGETTIARVELEDEPFTSQWWFWTATGGSVLVAGGITAGIVTWAALSQEQPARVVLGK